MPFWPVFLHWIAQHCVRIRAKHLPVTWASYSSGRPSNPCICRHYSVRVQVLLCVVCCPTCRTADTSMALRGTGYVWYDYTLQNGIAGDMWRLIPVRGPGHHVVKPCLPNRPLFQLSWSILIRWVDLPDWCVVEYLYVLRNSFPATCGVSSLSEDRATR